MARRSPAKAPRKVTLREESAEALWAYIDRRGALALEGHSIFNDGGDRDWTKTVPKVHLPRLRQLLGIPDGDDLLDGLVARYSGMASNELFRTLRENDIPTEDWSWISAHDRD